MLAMFKYNWQVREEWFDWCEQLSSEELLKPRVGGPGSILRTLFHVVDVEQAWIRGLQGKPEFHHRFHEYKSLHAVRDLSENCRPNVEGFVREWSKEIEHRMLDDFTYGEVIRHVIAHEIHHIGQLSVWSRQLDLNPVSANLIGRKIS